MKKLNMQLKQTLARCASQLIVIRMNEEVTNVKG